MRSVWLAHAPEIVQCSLRDQFLCLRGYIGEDEAVAAHHVWGRLSWACHHHPYQLAPTAVELRGWFAQVGSTMQRCREVASEAATAGDS